METRQPREPWNKSKLVGEKPPVEANDVRGVGSLDQPRPRPTPSRRFAKTTRMTGCRPLRPFTPCYGEVRYRSRTGPRCKQLPNCGLSCSRYGTTRL